MKQRNIGKDILRTAIILISAVLLFVLGVFINHSIITSQETQLLKEKGYYNRLNIING